MKTLRAKAKRQGELIKRTAKGNMRFSEKRLIIWKEGKVASWINKKDWKELNKELDYVKLKVKDKFSIETKVISFKKQIVTKEKRKEFDVKTYTKTQRQFITEEFKKRKIPVTKKTKLKKDGFTDMKEEFEMVNINISKLHSMSP